MDRFAVFVDAGYLYAEGGKLCCYNPERRSIRLHSSEVSKFLMSLAEEACGFPPLRTYWYDGAKDGVPTKEQQLIAALPNVKLRLGRINSKNQQKGVDALIYRDLMTLADKQAISEAYLLAGDEDLREGVRAAQDIGVRVTLIGVAARDGTRNQSKELVNEADETVTLTKKDLAPFIEPRQAPGRRAVVQADLLTEVSEAAARYARQWLDRATDKECESLRASWPAIPGTLDVSLLIAIEAEVGGSLRGREDLRRAARRAFWEQVG